MSTDDNERPDLIEIVAAELPQVAESVRNLRTARAAVKAAEDLLKAAVAEVGREVILQPARRRRAAYVLYWLAEDVPPQWAADAFGLSAYHLRELAGPARLVGAQCRVCGGPILMGSRTQLHSARHRAVPAECTTCHEARSVNDQERLRREWDRKEAEQKAWEARAERMTEDEYRATEYWQRLVTNRLAEIGRACEYCDAKGRPLQIFRSKAFSRGKEWWDPGSALLILCEHCRPEQGFAPPPTAG